MLSSARADFYRVRLTSRFRGCDMSLTTLLSLAGAVVVRLLARYASYPCLFAGLRQCPLTAAYPASGPYAVFLVSTFFTEFVTSVPRVEHSSRESRSRIGHFVNFGFTARRYALVCILPLGLSLPRAS